MYETVQSIYQASRVKGTEPPAGFKRKVCQLTFSTLVAFKWTIRHNTGRRGLTWNHLAFAAARSTTSRTHDDACFIGNLTSVRTVLVYDQTFIMAGCLLLVAACIPRI